MFPAVVVSPRVQQPQRNPAQGDSRPRLSGPKNAYREGECKVQLKMMETKGWDRPQGLQDRSHSRHSRANSSIVPTIPLYSGPIRKLETAFQEGERIGKNK